MTVLTPQDAKPESPLREILELRAERDLLRERERELVEALEWFVIGKGTPDLDGSIARALLAKYAR